MSGAQQVEQGAQAPDDLAAMPDEQVEGLARHLGWKPMEEGYRGKPENFRDARAFVETANRNPAVLWNNLQTLDKRYGKLETNARDTAEKLDKALDVINDMSTQFRSVSQRAYDKARADLLAQRDAAVDGGDRQAFTRADAELQELDKTKPAAPKTPPAAPAVQPPSQEVQEWGQRNPWFYTDTALQGEANALHLALLNTRRDLTLAENLAIVERQIKTLHPDKFPKAPAPKVEEEEVEEQEERRPAASGGERSNATPRQQAARNKRDFASLPKDSRQAFVRYKEMLGRKEGSRPLTESEWASNYYEQFPDEA